MDVAAMIVVAVIVLLTGVAVLGLFIWAAVKDGQEDRALQGLWVPRTQACSPEEEVGARQAA